jgi:signal transduction histidine kinase
MQTLYVPETIDVPKRGAAVHPSLSRDHLTDSILHDLRSPLTAISVCAEMLLDQDLPAAQSRRVAFNIHRSAGRMRELLTEFVSTVRGRMEPTANCNLLAILSASCEAAGVLEHGRIEVVLDVSKGIEIPVVRTRIERVFLNLILNSMEAMPRGGVIEITATKAGDSVVIEVEDTGPGIAPEIRGRLFEPFATAGKKDGVGLGLMLSRQIVRDHGGDLWVEPAPGARFLLSLPVPR